MENKLPYNPFMEPLCAINKPTVICEDDKKNDVLLGTICKVKTTMTGLCSVYYCYQKAHYPFDQCKDHEDKCQVCGGMTNHGDFNCKYCPSRFVNYPCQIKNACPCKKGHLMLQHQCVHCQGYGHIDWCCEIEDNNLSALFDDITK